MIEHPRITRAPDMLAGKPVIRGTRLSVEFVIGLMADGRSEAEMLQNYPGIEHDGLRRMPGDRDWLVWRAVMLSGFCPAGR